MSTGKSINTKPIDQNCKLAFILPSGLGGINFPSLPARPLNPVTINSLVISNTVTQILTLSIYVNPINIQVTKSLSAIVSKKAPVLVDTSHFLANLPSKKSVHAAINARIAGVNMSPFSDPSWRIRNKITGEESILNQAKRSGIRFFI